MMVPSGAYLSIHLHGADCFKVRFDHPPSIGSEYVTKYGRSLLSRIQNWDCLRHAFHDGASDSLHKLIPFGLRLRSLKSKILERPKSEVSGAASEKAPLSLGALW